MVDRSGHIVLDHRVDAIQVGHRHRQDLGDMTDLVDSIRDMGMLQPITISPDGVLICGARRLAVAKRLGMRRVNVWVRSGISTPLQHLLAEQHENMIRKSLSAVEAADMYAELKLLLTEDAAHRQHAHSSVPTSERSSVVPIRHHRRTASRGSRPHGW
jgi:ParB family chromosome partitioning protein